MNENRFLEQIAQLRNGEINELIIEPNDFMLFRDSWKELDDRAMIVGEAGLNGKIVYRYQPNK